MNGSTDLATVVQNYRNIVNKIRELAPNTKLYLLALHPTATANKNTNRVIPFNAELKTMADGLNGVEFIDTYTPFANGNLPKSNLFTGNYLYGKGYARMSQVLAPYLTEEGVVPTSDEEADSLIAAYAARNALGQAANLGNLPIGNALGEYNADSVAAFSGAINEAYALLATDAPTAEVAAFTEGFAARANAFREAINKPQASNDSVEYWYTICSTLRENRYITATDRLGALEGRNVADTAAMWKFVLRDDGKGYNIVNRKYGTYINPVCTYGQQFKMRSGVPTRGFLFSYANTPRMFILRTNTGNVQFNQTTSANSYKIFNWSSKQDGLDRTDTGCQFTLALVDEVLTGLMTTQTTPPAEIPAVYDLSGRPQASTSTPGIYIVSGKKMVVK